LFCPYGCYDNKIYLFTLKIKEFFMGYWTKQSPQKCLQEGLEIVAKREGICLSGIDKEGLEFVFF
jgi:hypothetical protein